MGRVRTQVPGRGAGKWHLIWWAKASLTFKGGLGSKYSQMVGMAAGLVAEQVVVVDILDREVVEVGLGVQRGLVMLQAGAVVGLLQLWY